MQKACSRRGPKSIAGCRKRHYTFARWLAGRLRCPCQARSNPHRNTLKLRGFCSLRLSVRTPPFHGGESGSIPLGSAIAGNSTGAPPCPRSISVLVFSQALPTAPPSRLIGVRMKREITIGLAVVAGAAVLEAALVPGLILGGAAWL